VKVLITGGHGFIARYLVRAITAEGWTVMTPGREELDVTNPSSIDSFFQDKKFKPDAVVHLAALLMIDGHHAQEYFRVNSFGAYNVLEMCRRSGIKKIVYAMTHSDQNKSPFPLVSEHEDYCVFGTNSFDPAHNAIPFIASKIAAMKMVEAYDREGVVQGISLRLSNIRGYGSRDTHYNSPFHQFIRKAIDGEDIEVWGDPPSTKRDMIYIKDVCSAFVAALKSKEHGTFNIGSGMGYTIEDEVKEIIQVFGNPLKTPQIIYRRDLPEVRKKNCIFNINKAVCKLGWSPRYDYRQGLFDFKKEMVIDSNRRRLMKKEGRSEC
jgi:UDP-glucose 4-epimerase